MKVVFGRLATWAMLIVAFIGLFALNTFGAITVDPTNAFSAAESGFNYGGGLGISLLTIAVVLGAIMFGWRLKSGRGK